MCVCHNNDLMNVANNIAVTVNVEFSPKNLSFLHSYISMPRSFYTTCILEHSYINCLYHQIIKKNKNKIKKIRSLEIIIIKKTTQQNRGIKNKNKLKESQNKLGTPTTGCQ